jgi:hypothetical protein
LNVKNKKSKQMNESIARDVQEFTRYPQTMTK